MAPAAIDAALLADLGRWRRWLARDLASHNRELDVSELNRVTQLTLDRLVFIRVCEDRRLEAVAVLRPLVDHNDPYAAFVASLSHLRARYDSALLAPDPADDVKVTRAVFARILRGLSAPWAPYRFDAIGVEILGSIHERVLASAITVDPHNRGVTVAPEPEVRKADGVYYTPSWVVDEIIRRTIDPLIAGKAPAELEKFRVLDPACGSGSFLLGAHRRLIAHFEAYYTANPTADRGLHGADAHGVQRLTTAARAKLLRNCIFGVDLDAAAVKVATLSLQLQCLQSGAAGPAAGETGPAGPTLPLAQRNIRCGNSLISTDYRQPRGGKWPDTSDRPRVRPFQWEHDTEGFGDVLADGGFDVVVANPPYFSIDRRYGVGHPVLAYLKRAYADVWLDKTDISYYFMRKAAELARRRLGLIVSRAFLEADKASRIRAWLAANARLERLQDFDGFRVFAGAGIATAIAIFDTTQPHGEHEVDVRRLRPGRRTTSQVLEGVREDREPFVRFSRAARLDRRPWHFPNPRHDGLLQRIDACGDELGRLCNLGQGMQTGANDVFAQFTAAEIDRLGFPRELVKRRARSCDINRCDIADGGIRGLYLEDVPAFGSLPARVRDHLNQRANRERLHARAAYKRGDCEWWRYAWPLHRHLHEQPRLVCPYRTGHLRFAIDENFSWLTLTDTTVAFVRADAEEDIRYLLGLLNSRVLTFRFRHLAKLTGPDMWEAFHNSIRRLPIRRIDFGDAAQHARHNAVVRLVREIEAHAGAAREALSASARSRAARRVATLTGELDRIALDLYGISDGAQRETVLALGAPRR